MRIKLMDALVDNKMSSVPLEGVNGRSGRDLTHRVKKLLLDGGRSIEEIPPLCNRQSRGGSSGSSNARLKAATRKLLD
jgi:hypothetical protein